MAVVECTNNNDYLELVRRMHRGEIIIKNQEARFDDRIFFEIEELPLRGYIPLFGDLITQTITTEPVSPSLATQQQDRKKHCGH